MINNIFFDLGSSFEWRFYLQLYRDILQLQGSRIEVDTVVARRSRIHTGHRWNSSYNELFNKDYYSLLHKFT